MRPKISIITCTYNSEKYLKEMLNSVEIQTYRNLEHIFIDAYSKDNTQKIMEEYKERNPDVLVKIFKRKPKGISDAMNFGIIKSKGEIIHILHSDDFFINKFALKIVIKIFKETKKNWIVGNPAYMENETIYIKNNPLYSIMIKHFISYKCFIQHPNVFVKKIFFDKYGFFNTEYKITMDYALWLKAIEIEFPYISNQSFTVFRKHNKNESLKYSNKDRKGKELNTLNYSNGIIKSILFLFLLKLYYLFDLLTIKKIKQKTI